MPNRCGIIHVRGEPPSNPIMRFEMNDYMKKFSEKVTNMLSEGQKLGMIRRYSKILKFKYHKVIQKLYRRALLLGWIKGHSS